MMIPESKNITIANVASLAGVSKATVSRFLNGRAVRAKTAERIETVVDLLKYEPNGIARSLKMKKTNMVGVLISDIATPFSSAIILGIGKVLMKNNYMPFFVNCSGSLPQEEAFTRSLFHKNVDGLIVNTTSNTNNYLISLACQGLPIVLCDRFVKDYNFDIVTTENKQAYLDMATHLKEQGYTTLAFFTQPYENNSTRITRRNEFLNASRAVYGADFGDKIFTFESDAGPQLKKYLQTVCKKEIPAIIATNTDTTIYVYRAIKQMGLSMPEQIGLIGPDDWDNSLNWAEIVDTGITTMKINAKEIGMRSAELLVEKLTAPGNEAKHIYIRQTLIPRNSTLRKAISTA